MVNYGSYNLSSTAPTYSYLPPQLLWNLGFVGRGGGGEQSTDMIDKFCMTCNMSQALCPVCETRILYSVQMPSILATFDVHPF